MSDTNPCEHLRRGSGGARCVLWAYPPVRGAGGLGGCVPLAPQPIARSRHDERGAAAAYGTMLAMLEVA